ncbi:hypothetical protein ABBQ32_012513 [Trebouxia sp. C0010 RCD-2024]
MPSEAPEPAGLRHREQDTILNSENVQLRLQLQRLQGQLQQEHLHQDATHIMVQRAAQLEIDFDQTAAMLCDEMAQRSERQTAVNKFQELYALEQKRCMMTMAALSGTKFQLYVQHQELHQSRDQLSAALAKLKAAKHNLPCPSSPAARHTTAATDATPRAQTLATQSVLESLPAQPHDEQRLRDSHTAAAVY